MKRLFSILMLVLSTSVLLAACSGGGGGGTNLNPTYTVTYNGNGNTGGSVPLDTTNYEQGQTITVLANTGNLVNTNCTFAGWNTQPNGSGTTYTQAQTFTMGAANVTLYAKWTANPTYTITYNGNGNTGGSVPIDTTNYEPGQTVTVLANTGNLVNTNYTFAGWNTQANGSGTTYTQTQTFTMGTANVTLYAKWTANPTYTVTYNGNGNTGGSVPIDTTNYEQGQTVTVLANTGNLVKGGYFFDGWNALADGTGTTYAPGQTFTMGVANVTLYAKWTANPTYAVTYNGNGNTGGSVPIDTTNYEQGQTVTVLGNTGNLVKGGYFFDGWNALVDGTGTTYAPGQTFTMGVASVTLYAKWTENLSAPTGVTATAGNQQNTIAWLPVTGATSYNIYWSTASGVNKQNGMEISSVPNPFTHLNITNWITYYYVVTAINVLGESAESQEVHATPQGIPGTLDTTFNGQGYVESNISSLGGYGSGITIDSSGRILVTGSSDNASGNSNMVICRYNSNGTLDTTFNNSGFVVSNVAAGGNGYDDGGNGITIDSSGRILVTGWSNNDGGGLSDNMTIWRYNADGTLDTTFSGQGYIVSSSTPTAGLRGDGITIDSSGKILVTGWYYEVNNGGDIGMVIWRYNADGTLDTTFNYPYGYVVPIKAATGSKYDYGNGITIDSSGRILVTGYSVNEGYPGYMVIWRYNADGTLDTTFNSPYGYVVSNGVAGGTSYNLDYGNGITIDSNGRILVSGTAKNWATEVSDMVIWRYNANGTLDTTFYGQGFVVTNGPYDGGSGITIDSSGRILVTGSSSSSELTGPINSDMVIWRYLSNGTLDKTFNIQGYVATSGPNDYGEGIVIDSNGRILIIGTNSSATGIEEMAIWRYNP